MSIKRKKNLSIINNRINAVGEWSRPTDWVAMPDIESTPNTAYVIFAVYDTDSEWVALGAGTSSGQYTVNWGDGTSDNVNSLVNINHQYTYSSITNPVTSMGYKTVLATLTAVSGNITGFYSNLIPTVFPGSGFQSNILEIGLNLPNASSGGVQIGSSSFPHPLMQSYRATTNTLISASNAFHSCRSLQYVSELNLSGNTATTSMFQGCSSLVNTPVFRNTSGITTFGSMFLGCSKLKYLNAFLLPAGNTLYNNMFQDCVSLEYIPPLIFKASSMVQTFAGCNNLKIIDATFDLSSTTSTVAMFDACKSLETVPPSINTTSTSLTGSAQMFRDCWSLKSVPLVNTTNVTDTSAMFQNCYSLQSIPAFNFGKVTTFTNTFNACTSLATINNITMNTTANVTMTGSFNGCNILSDLQFTFFGWPSTPTSPFPANSIRKFRVPNGLNQSFSLSTNKLSKAELEITFGNLVSGTASGKSLTITSNWGAPTPISKTSCGITATSVTITQSNTSSLAVGMVATGTGTPLTTTTAVTTDATADTIGLTGHNIPAGTAMSFATIVTTTGIVINTIYYVVNPTTNAFQISLTQGGSPIDLVTNGTGTIRWNSIITAINPNVSITMSAPMATTNAGATLSFQALQVGTLLLKGWAVTI